MDDRATYNEIRSWFLGCYYKYCRFKLGQGSAWVEGESELGYAYSELENSFEMPIEKLMLEVLTLILSAGRAPKESYTYHWKCMCALLEQMDVPRTLESLPPDEAEEFKIDLRILDVLQPSTRG